MDCSEQWTAEGGPASWSGTDATLGGRQLQRMGRCPVVVAAGKRPNALIPACEWEREKKPGGDPVQAPENRDRRRRQSGRASLQEESNKAECQTEADTEPNPGKEAPEGPCDPVLWVLRELASAEEAYRKPDSGDGELRGWIEVQQPVEHGAPNG